MPYDNWVSIEPLNYAHRKLGASQEIVDLCMVVKAADMYLHDFSHGHEYTYEEWRIRNRLSPTLTFNKKTTAHWRAAAR